MSNQSPGLAEKNRVAILISFLAPYRIPVFNRIAKIPNLDLRVILANEVKLSESHLKRQIEFNYEVLPAIRRTVKTHYGERGAMYFSPSLWQHLKRNCYDVIVTHGWTIPNTWSARVYGGLARRPVVLWEDSIPHAPGAAKRLLMPLLKRYVHSFEGYLAASDACIDYMVSMGADRARTTLLPQIVDTDFFAEASAPYRAAPLESKRALGVSTSRLVLFVGALTENKGVLTLLEAFKVLAAKCEDVSLMYVGRGPLGAELAKRIAAYGLEDRVLLYGFAAQSELPKIYGAADIFVLPSAYDTFGAVICEAMSSGLPILTTNRVGAVSNVVFDGVNGVVVEPHSMESLSKGLEFLLRDDKVRERMGQESQRVISHWNVELVAANFGACIAACTQRVKE